MTPVAVPRMLVGLEADAEEGVGLTGVNEVSQELDPIS